jgi:hypothetical protein
MTVSSYAELDASDVEKAEEHLLALSSSQEVWSPKDLRQKARNGLPFEIISLAFWRLMNRGELILDEDRQIRKAPR